VIDLLVVGAGPVGLATAVGARLAGLEVAVVEPRGGPIDKACGEGLMPDALARLHRLGIDPDGVDFRGIRYLRDGHHAEARFSRGAGRGVRRTELHAAMTRRAQELGVPVVDRRVEAVEQDAHGIEAAGIRARYLVGADGLHSTVRRLLGLETIASGVPRFGIRQHYDVAPWTDLVEVHWLADCEVYVTPVGERTVGVAVLGGAPLSLDHALARLPALAARLSGAPTSSRRRGAGPLRQSTTARTRGRALLVGDAAGYVDALTGEGLRVGFAEAEAAVRAVVAEDLHGYEDRWRTITRSYRWLTTGLLWTGSRPHLRPLIVPAAQRMPFAFRRIVDSLAS
jgi:flavin-dependent dehydrogenase